MLLEVFNLLREVLNLLLGVSNLLLEVFNLLQLPGVFHLLLEVFNLHLLQLSGGLQPASIFWRSSTCSSSEGKHLVLGFLSLEVVDVKCTVNVLQS